jgi:alpha-aminoadipate/glutamate carrier protein LysW
VTVLACPECAADVNVGTESELNEILECGECAGELEVISVKPLTIALAPEVEEDWGE